MAAASFARTNFLGGEWSKTAQGRADAPEYTHAFDLCYNSLPVEAGAWTRRPGTKQTATTRKGAEAVTRTFDFEAFAPYDLEFTAGVARPLAGGQPILTNAVAVSSIAATLTTSKASATIQTGSAHGWSVGQQIMFQLITQAGDFVNVAPLIGCQFEVIAVPDTTHVTIVDSLTREFDSSRVVLGTNVVKAAAIVEFTTLYQTADLDNIRLIQADGYAYVLCPGYAPYVLTQVTAPTLSTPATFSWAPLVFLDGPYLDPPTDGSYITPSGTTGAITITASSVASINGGTGFTAADVGRLVRLYSAPAAWNSGTAYAVGNQVLYGGVAFTCITASTNNQPDVSPLSWAINPTGAYWTWGTIISFTNATTVGLQLAAAATDADGVSLAGGPLLNTNNITTWRLGSYGGNPGYPTCGTWHEGRLWLGGPAPNNFNAGVSNGRRAIDGAMAFYPTDLYGTVSDNCAINETLNAPAINAIYWMTPDHNGLVFGTKAGEWAIGASSTNDFLTPTNIQAKRVTKFGSENIEPRHGGMAFLFVRRYGKKLVEYISDVYSSKYTGLNLSEKAEHLMGPGIAEIAYVQETTPVIWARMNDGTLNGMTYRRDSPFGTQPPTFYGWHRHTLGSGRYVRSIQGGPAVGGSTDTLTLVTKDTVTGYYFIEKMTPVFVETDQPQDAWFTDGGATPTHVDLVNDDAGVTYYRFYGLYYIVGQTISVFLAGVDLGDYQVQAGGFVDVPTSVAASYFTPDYLQQLFNAPAPRWTTNINVPGNGLYVMAAEENFDPSSAAQIAAVGALSTVDVPYVNTPNVIAADNTAAGISYNPNRRSFFYVAFDYEPLQKGTSVFGDSIDYFNQTGYTLWSGENVYPNFTQVIGQFATPNICEKNIDTGIVTTRSMYSPNQIVPGGYGSIAIGIEDPGFGMTNATIHVTTAPGDTGSGLVATLSLDGDGRASQVTIVNPGNGLYKTEPILTVTDTPGGPLVAVAKLRASTSVSPTVDGTDGALLPGAAGWRRCAEDFATSGGNVPVVSNVLNNDLWVHSQSCELYHLRFVDNWSMGIRPFIGDTSGGPSASNNVLALAFDGTWCYAMENVPTYVSTPQYINLIPAAITADERAADRKLAYTRTAVSGWPAAATSYRFILGTDGNGYILAQNVTSTARVSTVLKMVPPAFAAHGSVSAPVVTNLALWTPGTGPDVHGASTANNDHASGPNYTEWSNNFLWRLPATNQAVAIQCHYKEQVYPTGSSDFTTTHIDCINLQLGGTPTADFHADFVRGLMDLNWLPQTSLTGLNGWAVQLVRETDQWRETTGSVQPGVDYTKRWLLFDCYPVVNGVIGTTLHTVFVEYQFTYGSAPTVLRVIDEGGWDSAYTQYASDIGNVNVVQASSPVVTNPTFDGGWLNNFQDAPIYDPVSQSFWFSGQTYNNVSGEALNMLRLDPALAYRRYVNNFPNGTTAGWYMTAPFLKLTFASTFAVTVSASLGFNYQSKVILVKPVAEAETGARNGPGFGKTRRVQQFAAVLVNTAGVAFGVDDDAQRPAAFTSPGGTAYANNELFTGTYFSVIDNQYSYEGKLTWSTSRPYPATVTAIEGFIHTQDR